MEGKKKSMYRVAGQEERNKCRPVDLLFRWLSHGDFDHFYLFLFGLSFLSFLSVSHFLSPLAFPSGFHFPCVSARQFISELFIASMRFTHSRPCCLVDSIMTWDSFSGRRWFRRLIWSMFDGVVDGSFPPRRSCGANRRSRRRYANEHFRHSPVEATAADLIGKLEASVGGGGAAAASSVSSSGRQSQQSEKKKDRRGAAASSVPSSGRQP